MTRLLFVPVFIWTFLDSQNSVGHRFICALVFLVAALTDFVDGYLARKNNLVTNFGKIADPIADKLLTGAALIGLSWEGTVWWWVTIVILAREIGITLLRFWVIKRAVVDASRGGKWKTGMQITAIVAYLLPSSVFTTAVGQLSMAIALSLTVLTGIDYLRAVVAINRN
jgi:CDP-diacylglycerol--glycerol-3-phosphate 3-phosphatidyltransferase